MKATEPKVKAAPGKPKKGKDGEFIMADDAVATADTQPPQLFGSKIVAQARKRVGGKTR